MYHVGYIGYIVASHAPTNSYHHHPPFHRSEWLLASIFSARVHISQTPLQLAKVIWLVHTNGVWIEVIKNTLGWDHAGVPGWLCDGGKYMSNLQFWLPCSINQFYDPIECDPLMGRTALVTHWSGSLVLQTFWTMSSFIKCSIHWMDQKVVVCVHNVMLFSYQKGQTWYICGNMDRPRRNHARWI